MWQIQSKTEERIEAMEGMKYFCIFYAGYCVGHFFAYFANLRLG
jgi:hypothetical protein